MKEKGRVLVAFAHGEGFVLLFAGDEVLTDFISDAGASPDGFGLSEVGADVKLPTADGSSIKDGVYLGSMKLEDDGPGDYPGTREVCLTVDDLRPVSKEEWNDYRNGEYPWPVSTGDRGPDV